MIRSSVASARYAEGFFRAAQKSGRAPEAAEDFRDLAAAWKSSGLKFFLESPGYSLETKRNFLMKLEGRFRAPLVIALLDLLVRKSRVGLLEEIHGCYQKLLDLDRGIMEAEVDFARKPSEDLLEKTRGRLEKFTGKTVRLAQKVRPDLVAGGVIRAGHRMLDGSLRSRLDELKKRLVSAELD